MTPSLLRTGSIAVLLFALTFAPIHAQEPQEAPPPQPQEALPPPEGQAAPAPEEQPAPPEQAPPAPPEEGGGDQGADAANRTPPRLSYAYGQVSFSRAGADDWTPAQINTALAPDDALYTGTGAAVELQVGSRSYVRAAGDTQLGLENQEPDFLQLKVTAGHAVLDLLGRLRVDVASKDVDGLVLLRTQRLRYGLQCHQ